MKHFILVTSLSIIASSAVADVPSTADYIVEVGAVSMSGRAAVDLYLDVEAKEKVLDTVTRLQNREKRKGSVRCVAEFIRGLEEDSNQMGEWVVNDATCTVKIPSSIIGPRE